MMQPQAAAERLVRSGIRSGGGHSRGRLFLSAVKAKTVHGNRSSSSRSHRPLLWMLLVIPLGFLVSGGY
jgi:hypothetical protein